MSRIVTNTNANSVYKSYSRNQAAMTSSMEKLSTGLRINRASDDSSGLAISETLRGDIKGTDSALDSIANASNLANVTDGYLQTIHDILGRMEELAVKNGDGSLSVGDKANITAEMTSLNGQITSIGTATFNGANVFGAAKSFVTDVAGGTVTWTIAAIAGPGVAATVANVRTAIGLASTGRGTLGAAQSQLNYVSTSQQNLSENLSAMESRIRNVDVAKESTNFAKNQILVQASTAMLAQANANSQNVLSLLK
jgi:flagellin